MTNPIPTTDETPNPHGDVTGEHASRQAFSEVTEKFKELLKGMFENPHLLRDPDLIDALTDDLHQIIDEGLTDFYAKQPSSEIDPNLIDDEGDE